MYKKVLVLVPHPDDAEFYAGGTISLWAAEGAEIIIAVATDGSRGTLVHSRAELTGLRREEARRACAVMGANPPIFLNHTDFELDRLPAGLLREEFMRLIRQVRPDALICQDAFAADEVHPDHRAAAWAAADAVNYSTLPLVYEEHRQAGLEPFFVMDKYFYSESNAGANTWVDISATIERKVAALACHQTQVEFMVADLQQQLSLVGQDLYAMRPEFHPGDPQGVMAWAIRETAAAVGQPRGIAFAEAFRHERFHLYPFVVEES